MPETTAKRCPFCGATPERKSWGFVHPQARCLHSNAVIYDSQLPLWNNRYVERPQQQAIVDGPRGAEFQPDYIASMGDIEERN